MGISVYATLFALGAAVAVYLLTRGRLGTGRAALAAVATFLVLAAIFLFLLGQALSTM